MRRLMFDLGREITFELNNIGIKGNIFQKEMNMNNGNARDRKQTKLNIKEKEEKGEQKTETISRLRVGFGKRSNIYQN